MSHYLSTTCHYTFWASRTTKIAISVQKGAPEGSNLILLALKHHTCKYPNKFRYANCPLSQCFCASTLLRTVVFLFFRFLGGFFLSGWIISLSWRLALDLCADKSKQTPAMVEICKWCQLAGQTSSLSVFLTQNINFQSLWPFQQRMRAPYEIRKLTLTSTGHKSFPFI